MKKNGLFKKIILSKINFFNVFNLLIIIFLIWLPYYLFNGRLFLGGDDTRFYFTYPKLFLDSLVPYSWNNISSLPYYIPNHHWLPFVFTLSIVDGLIKSKTILSYLCFSFVLIFGFIYFQKFIQEIIGNEREIVFLSALMYIFSPITLVSLSYFLSPVWLITLFPIIGYYYLRYIRSGESQYISKIVLFSIAFSFVFYSIPWILGLVFPLIGGMILYFVYVNRSHKNILLRTIIFGFFIGISQLFWAIPFFFSLVSGGQTSLGQKVFSADLAQSFAATVIVTANDNIIYPLLNLYHRRLVFDFEWHLKDVFLNFYDKTLILSSIYPAVLFLGFIKFGKALTSASRKAFIFLAVSFLISLYFSTVNIGFLKQLFVLFVYLPGFAILRNFTDKFALGYIFLYSSLLASCLLVIKRSFKIYYLIAFLVLVVELLNFMPVKTIIASPLWKTADIFTTTKIPDEYTSFLQILKGSISHESNIIAFPQNIATYAIIPEDNNRNVYVGTSPFKFFTGINDLSGEGSYPPYISQTIKNDVINRKYKDLLEMLSKINAGYVMTTNNIPQEVFNSYLFDKKYLKFEDKKLINSIAQHEIIKSSKGNYVLYKLNNFPRHIYSDTPISYKRINPIHYEINFKNFKGKHKILFLETFHPGWKLYLYKEHKNYNLISELLLFFKKPIFDNSHKQLSPYGNQWTVNSDLIGTKLDKSDYVKNSDGTVNVTFELYFAPQSYFYIGIFMTIVLLFAGFYFLFKYDKYEKKRKK